MVTLHDADLPPCHSFTGYSFRCWWIPIYRSCRRFTNVSISSDIIGARTCFVPWFMGSRSQFCSCSVFLSLFDFLTCRRNV